MIVSLRKNLSGIDGLIRVLDGSWCAIIIGGMLVGVDGCWWVLLSINECWWVLMGAGECWSVLMSVGGCW